MVCCLSRIMNLIYCQVICTLPLIFRLICFLSKIMLKNKKMLILCFMEIILQLISLRALDMKQLYRRFHFKFQELLIAQYNCSRQYLKHIFYFQSSNPYLYKILVQSVIIFLFGFIKIFLSMGKHSNQPDPIWSFLIKFHTQFKLQLRLIICIPLFVLSYVIIPFIATQMFSLYEFNACYKD